VNRLLDDETDSQDRGYPGQRRSASYDPAPEEEHDREISLGTPTILGIFFALAIICACFFGFGYNMGRKSGQSAAPAASIDNPPSSFSGAPKPAAGSAASQPVAHSAQSAEPTPESAPPTPPAETATVPLAPPSTSSSTITAADRMIAGEKAPPTTTQPATASQQPAAETIPAGSFVVQVAAVSSQDVADILLSSLQKKGYTVAVRHEPQDKLLHVQIGPFADKKDAEAMRARVLADGFNAIVK